MKKKLVTITALAITLIIVQTTKSISLNRTQMKQSYTQHKPNAQPEEADLAITLCEAIINHHDTDPDAQTSIAANIWHYNYTMTKLKSTNPSLYNNLIQKKLS